jgi:hypothetical protein
MLSRIRKRFTYANVAMTVCLVFAVRGGAQGRKKYLVRTVRSRIGGAVAPRNEKCTVATLIC